MSGKVQTQASEDWPDDLLDRRADALFLIDFLVRKIEERGKRGAKRNFVLNIDAPWGDGKTFFLTNLQKMLRARRYVVPLINAWSDDHADDPLLAVMAGIDTEFAAIGGGKVKKPLGKLTQIAGQVVAASAKGLIRHTASRVLGDDAVEEISAVIGKSATDFAGAVGHEAAAAADKIYDDQGKVLLEKFHTSQRSIGEFKAQLSRVLVALNAKGETALPLFVLIDELDRCRPNYAVAMLERVKHLFEIDDVVFILATDTGQLKHSIKALYGADFHSGRYLLRFFDQTYRFDPANSIEEFVKRQFADIDISKLTAPNNAIAAFTASAFKMCGLSLRDAEQCMDIIRNCVTVWRAKCPLVLLVLIPLVVQQQQRILVGHLNQRSKLKEATGEVAEWPIDLGLYEKGKKAIVDGWALLERVVSTAQTTNLPRIMNDTDVSANSQTRAFLEIFGVEFSLRFGQGYQANDPPMSLINNYPALVRSVGRLTPV